MKITNFHLLDVQLCLYRSRKMSLVHNKLPLFSDQKIILSLATYAVCQPCIVADCSYDCNKNLGIQKGQPFLHIFQDVLLLQQNFERQQGFHHYFFQINKLRPARINTFQRLICFDICYQNNQYFEPLRENSSINKGLNASCSLLVIPYVLI